jgi:hypothetical protein
MVAAVIIVLMDMQVVVVHILVIQIIFAAARLLVAMVEVCVNGVLNDGLIMVKIIIG